MYSTQIATEPNACNIRFRLNTIDRGGPIMSTVDDSVIARFWQKVNKTNSCWLWTGTTVTKGYGSFYLKCQGECKTQSAHRASWIIHNGPIPDGLWVLHKCDNPPCVNPSHLFLGTNKDNVNDMIRKGRKHQLTNKDFTRAILNEQTVMELRRDAARGISIRSLAGKYQLDETSIRDAVAGRSWKGLPVLGRPRSEFLDLKKKCGWCASEITRRTNGGKVLSIADFAKRQFCSISCGTSHSMAVKYSLKRKTA